MNYTSRIADAELRRKLSGTGTVLIEGPKARGKTETARQVAAREVLLDVDVAARRALDSPSERRSYSKDRHRACSTSGRSSQRSGTMSDAPWTTDGCPASSCSPDRPYPRTTSPGTPGQAGSPA